MNIHEKMEAIIKIQKQISALNNKLNELKADLQTDFKNNEQLRDKTIKFNDYKICLSNDVCYSALSYKFLESKLGDLIKNEEKVAEIISYLKKSREKKTVETLKIIPPKNNVADKI